MTSAAPIELAPLIGPKHSEELPKDVLKKITPSSNLISNAALSSLAATSTTTGGLILFKVVAGLTCPTLFVISTVAFAGLGIHRAVNRSYSLSFKETLHNFPGEKGKAMVAVCGYPFESQIMNFKLEEQILGVESVMKNDFGRMDFFINDVKMEGFPSSVKKIVDLLPNDKSAHSRLTKISQLFNSQVCVDLNHKVATFFMKNKNFLKKVPFENLVFENHDKDPFVHLKITPKESYIFSSITWEAYDAINEGVREDRLIKSEVVHNLDTNSSSYRFSFV